MRDDAFDFFSTEGIWITEVIFGIVFLIIANWGLKQLIAYFRRRTLANLPHWKEKIESIVYLPLHLLLWIFVGAYIFDVLGRRFGFDAILDYLDPLRSAAVVLCLTWMFLRWKTELQHIIVAKGQHKQIKIDPSTVHIIGKLSTIAIAIVSILIILQILGLNIVPLVAFGGIGAAAVGFAGKDVIANFFGGLMLYITRPFTVGDLILLPDRQLEGNVEEIGWYTTSVRDKDKRPVYLPNSIFSTMLVINSSRMTHRHILEKIGIRYEDIAKVKTISEDIRKEIVSHPEIDTQLPVLVFFNEFGDSSINILVDAYTLSTRLDEYLLVKQDILLKIFEVVARHEGEMPYPTFVLQTPNRIMS